MLHPVGLPLVAVERGLPLNMREPIHRVAALVGEGADVAVERVEVVDHEVILQRLGDLRHAVICHGRMERSVFGRSSTSCPWMRMTPCPSQM